MNFTKKYLFVLVVVLLVAALFLIRFISDMHFRNGAEKNATPAMLSSNILLATSENLSMEGALYIDLDPGPDHDPRIKGEVRKIDPKSLLNPDSFRLIRASGSPLILVSSDPTILARSWMLLAQKGVSNIFILETDASQEVFKYEFRPDTIKVSDTGIE